MSSQNSGFDQNQPLAPGQGRCEITGKVFDESDLITFQGRTVCAEGKEILLARLKSGERMPGELERPTVLKRFGCLFVDGIIISLLMLVAGIIMGVNLFSTDNITEENVLSGIGLITFVVILLSILYYALMHGLRGQTLGKMAGKLKVVNLDGSAITMKTAFLRAFAYSGPALLASVLMIIEIGDGSIRAADVLANLYGLVNTVFALADRSMQRALHDRIAGTRVIMID